MGQREIFLTIADLTLGVDKLLAFVADRAAVESRRPPTPPNGGLAVKTVVREFRDGVTFQLDVLSCRPPTRTDRGISDAIWQLLEGVTAGHLRRAMETADLGVEMHWYCAELPPKELYDRPGTEWTLGAKTSPSWRLDVSVCEDCYPWINPGRDRDLRRVRSIMDGYARPRLILPKTGAAGFREDFIALLALFAAKAQCTAPRDEQLPRFFRSYCDGLFRREREHRKLSEAEWLGVVDRVLERLYSGKAGMGFTMPAFPASFRAYVSRAIRGAVASSRCKSQPVLKRVRSPLSIGEAAARLGVSHMTVRRCMVRQHFREWTEEAWLVVSSKVSAKKRWQKVIVRLQASGLRAETARKRVQRWKRRGLTLDEAIRRSSPASPRGTCAACGQEQAVGELYGGKFFCGECLGEKMRMGGAEGM